MSTNSHRLRLAWYGATVFLSSAVLLVLEITAGRLIAPYVGVTIYSWTSIIGVILAGLSLGNWIGGR
ncbi:MAG TPA: fused MFS/spermidine synthase, partial [Gammaproteobacteria bacterium]